MMGKRGFERHHGYLQDRFPVARQADELRVFALSDEELHELDRLGYLTGIDLLSEEQVGERRSRLVSLGERLAEVSDLLHEGEGTPPTDRGARWS